MTWVSVALLTALPYSSDVLSLYLDSKRCRLSRRWLLDTLHKVVLTMWNKCRFWASDWGFTHEQRIYEYKTAASGFRVTWLRGGWSRLEGLMSKTSCPVTYLVLCPCLRMSFLKSSSLSFLQSCWTMQYDTQYNVSWFTYISDIL